MFNVHSMVLLQDYSKFHVSYPMIFIILPFGSCLLSPTCQSIKNAEKIE